MSVLTTLRLNIANNLPELANVLATLQHLANKIAKFSKQFGEVANLGGWSVYSVCSIFKSALLHLTQQNVRRFFEPVLIT